MKEHATKECPRKKRAAKRYFERTAPITLAVCLLGALFVLPANADVVWSDPNDFYEQHKNDCVEERQVFDLPPGVEVSLKVSPGSQTEKELDDYWKKQFKDYGVFITCTYNYQGEIWGYVDEVSHGPSISGWVPLDDATIAYTPDDFLKDYGDSFYTYFGNPKDIIKHLESLDVVFWRWPCSGRIERANSEWGGLYASYSPDALKDRTNYDLSRMYKDELGREWVYFNSTAQHGWICLDDPDSLDMPTTIANFQPWSWNLKDYPNNGFWGISIPVLVIILVATVVAVSLVIILLLHRPKKKTPRN